MKKTGLLLVSILTAAMLHAQQVIKIEDINGHVGDSVTICTKIYGGIFLDRSKGTPTLLNAGGSYPNAPLTVLLWPDTRSKYKTAPEELFKDRNVCITGKIILYKEKPEIVIYDEKQIVLKD